MTRPRKTKSLFEGHIATKGKVEYQFKVFGGITIVFIEIKLPTGTQTERLNAVAQVMAECEVMVPVFELYAYMHY